MELDPEIDRAYPRQWMGRVTVLTRDGRVLEGRITSPKGDPDNTLTREELEEKARRLASYAGGATPEEIEEIIGRIWHLREQADMRYFLKQH
jgi:2-methylcitrate dehydratase PrpD